MRTYWSMLGPGRDGPSIAAELDRLEALGVGGVVAPQVYAPPFVALAAAAMANSRLQLGSGIAIALTRSPFETACAALELDRISAGRFTLGLGVGPRHWVNYFGSYYDRPVARVRDPLGHSSVSTTNGYLHARPNDSSARYLAVWARRTPAARRRPRAVGRCRA